MSLQEVSSLPPNKILDERGEGNRGGGYRSARRLSQLTQRAVDKALKLQAESGRFVDVVDTQSCGDPGEFRCLMKYPFSPSASKLLNTPTFLFPSSSSRSWTLPKESQDRRTIAAKIYSFLIEWRSDVSFEWRSRVVLAVPILEEALYRVAKCKEDYASQQLLEHVLLHFEAGNGLFLLQGTKPLYPVQASHAASLMGQDTLEQINCITVDSRKITPFVALPLENATVLPANDLGSGSDSESYFTDNSALWDALELGHPTSMEVGLHECRDNPGKRITKRVVSMLSKRRSDNHTLSRYELTNTTYSEENIPSAGVRVDGAKTEMRNDGEFCEPSRIKQESPCYGDTRTRKSSRKTLGDMINISLSNLPAIGSSFSSNVDEARPLPFKNEESNCLPTCSKHLHSFCTLNSTEAMRPFPSSSNMAKYSSIELMGPSSDKAKQSTGPSSSSELPVAPISLPSHTEALQLSPSPPKPKASPAPFSSSSSSLSSALSDVSSSSSSSVSCVSSSISCVSSSSSPALVSSSLPMSQVSSSSHVLSSSTSISHVSSSSLSLRDVSSLSSSHTAQISISSPPKLAPSSPPTESLTQLLHHMPPSSVFIEGEQNQELEEQMPTTAATSQDIETGAASRSLLSTTITATANQSLLSTTAATSQEIETDAASRSLLSTTITATASNDSSLEARERGPRLPLSIFLSERDEFDVDSLTETLGDNVRSWNTWEEPTEQIDPLCCVCMIGLKGAAFIPCGHTFCRKCSRELWRGRGACPLCNRYIREILDVY